jgi:sec-independent protein translocase protein TatA
MDIGMPELIIVLIIVVLVFGVGRIGRVGSELGQAIKGFRNGLADPAKPAEAPVITAASVEQPADIPAAEPLVVATAAAGSADQTGQ